MCLKSHSDEKRPNKTQKITPKRKLKPTNKKHKMTINRATTKIHTKSAQR